MADTPEAIRKSIRTYLFVGGVLFLGTVLTVLVATIPALDFGRHGFDPMDAVVGFAIAAVKAANESLIATINDSLTIADAGKKSRAAAEAELIKMEGELKATLAAARGRTAAA